MLYWFHGIAILSYGIVTYFFPFAYKFVDPVKCLFGGFTGVSVCENPTSECGGTCVGLYTSFVVRSGPCAPATVCLCGGVFLTVYLRKCLLIYIRVLLPTCACVCAATSWPPSPNNTPTPQNFQPKAMMPQASLKCRNWHQFNSSVLKVRRTHIFSLSWNCGILEWCKEMKVAPRLRVGAAYIPWWVSPPPPKK